VSCSADSWLKTRRESAPCCVTSPRRACRSAEEGTLWGSDRGDTRQAGGRHAIGRLHGRIPASGAAVEAEQGPQLYLGMRPEIRRTRDRSAALDRLRGQIPEENSGPLFHPAAIPAPRSTGPRHCRGLAPSLTPISQVFRSMLDCCQIAIKTAFEVLRLIPRISRTGHYGCNSCTSSVSSRTTCLVSRNASPLTRKVSSARSPSVLIFAV
jgi:hypothetical protein